MSDGVLVGIIAALSAIVVALVTVGLPMLVSARKHAKQANYQVTNNHETNLRDEQDQRHTANTSRLGSLERRMGGLERGMGRIEDHLGIEHTTPRQQRR